MKKLLIVLSALCLAISLVTSVYTLPPVPMGWGGDDRMELTANTTLSTTNVFATKYFTNQGATGEIDVVLPAISIWGVSKIFMIEEAQNIEINPPSGETFDLDGVTLDADDCVDSDSTVGSKIVVTRMKNAAGTWIWSLDTVRGSWVDTGASD